MTFKIDLNKIKNLKFFDPKSPLDQSDADRFQYLEFAGTDKADSLYWDKVRDPIINIVTQFKSKTDYMHWYDMDLVFQGGKGDDLFSLPPLIQGEMYSLNCEGGDGNDVFRVIHEPAREIGNNPSKSKGSTKYYIGDYKTIEGGKGKDVVIVHDLSKYKALKSKPGTESRNLVLWSKSVNGPRISVYNDVEVIVDDKTKREYTFSQLLGSATFDLRADNWGVFPSSQMPVWPV